MNHESIKQGQKVNIEGEGVDEWGERYIKFSVPGSNKVIPPFRAKDIVEVCASVSKIVPANGRIGTSLA